MKPKSLLEEIYDREAAKAAERIDWELSIPASMITEIRKVVKALHGGNPA